MAITGMKRKRAVKNYRRRVRRRVARPMATRNLRIPILNYKRKYSNQTIVPSTASTAGFWQYFGFQPTVLPNWSELSNLFETFKVCAIKWTYYPRYTDVEGGSAPLVYATYQIDPKSVIAPSGTYSRATYNTLLEQFGTRTIRCDKPFSVYYKPKVFDDINGVAASKWVNPYLSTSTGGSTIYRGHHMFFHDANFSGTGFANFSCEQVITVYMKLKNFK